VTETGSRIGRQRLETALAHREPDRIPFDLGGTETSGISVVALENWLRFNGIRHDPIEIFSLVTQLGTIDEEVLRRFGVDTRCLRTHPPASHRLTLQEDAHHRSFYDEWGIRWQMPKPGGHYYDIGEFPLSGCESVEDVERYHWPDPHDPSRYAGLKREARMLNTSSGAGIVMERHTGGIFETAWWMRGMENLLADLALDSPVGQAVLQRVFEQKMAYWERALAEVADEIVVAAEADDLSSQNGMIMSLDMYRRHLKPLHRQLFSYIKSKAPWVKLFFHSCGSVYDLIPDLIEIGVDILNPVQVSAAKMDTAVLKKQFGRDLVFWGGGVDTQRVLPFGTPQQVKDEVRRRIDDLAPGGGFVFAAVHCIQEDVPPQNIQAMWEALRE
jgi:uroporphyrinogen decarboxylase